MTPTFRHFAAFASIVILVTVTGPVLPAFAVDTTVKDGTIAPTPIAIPVFQSEDPKFGADVAGVIAADLGNSGLFQILDPASFLETGDPAVQPNFNNWRPLKADALTVGHVTRTPDGRVQAEFRLFDVVNGKQKASGQFKTIAQNWRRIGHLGLHCWE